MVSIKNFTSFLSKITILGILVSCNVIQTITGEETTVKFDPNSHGYESLYNDLYAFWRFEESTGTGYFGQGPALFSSGVAPIAGYFGNGVDCSSYSSPPQQSGLAFSVGPSDSFSVSFWKYDGGSGSDQVYLELYESSGPTSIDLGEDTGAGVFIKGMYTASSSINVFSYQNSWVHFVYVFRNGGQDVDIYVDGVLLDTVTYGVINKVFSTISLCNQQSLGSKLMGRMDSVGIWRRALSQDEINDLFSGTNPLD